MYVSEFTQFIREWLDNHPEEREVRRTGREIWWDKPQDLEARRKFNEVRVPTRPYYYDILR